MRLQPSIRSLISGPPVGPAKRSYCLMLYQLMIAEDTSQSALTELVFTQTPSHWTLVRVLLPLGTDAQHREWFDRADCWLRVNTSGGWTAIGDVENGDVYARFEHAGDGTLFLQALPSRPGSGTVK